MDISLAGQCRVTAGSALGCTRLQACHRGPCRHCWWSHLFLHINSILSPDQGRTPAFHCGGTVGEGREDGAGWATCRCYYSREAPRRTSGCMRAHTHTHACMHTLLAALESCLCACLRVCNKSPNPMSNLGLLCLHAVIKLQSHFMIFIKACVECDRQSGLTYVWLTF